MMQLWDGVLETNIFYRHFTILLKAFYENIRVKSRENLMFFLNICTYSNKTKIQYIYLKMKNYPDAIDYALQVLSILKRNEDKDLELAAYQILEKTYFEQGNYKDALEALKKANDLIEDHVVKEHLGDVYYKLNLVDDALKLWQGSLELLPNQEQVSKKINDIKGIQASK